MKLYALLNGSETIDKSFFVAGSNAGTATNKNPVHEWIDFPIPAYLIEHDDGYILFDTGCDPDWEANWPPKITADSPYFVTEDQQVLNHLKRLHVSPDDIKYVVISHLHVDHAGNLFRFKSAEVFVNETELMTTLKNYVTGGDLDVHVPTDIEHFIAAKLKWHLLEDDVKEYGLVKGITLLNFGSGHSYGMVGMRVELPNTGNLLFVSDALYCRENLYPKIQVPGILYDSLGYKRTAQYILNYAKKTNSQIVFGHDQQQFEELSKSEKGYLD